jgi:hypothetical protein
MSPGTWRIAEGRDRPADKVLIDEALIVHDSVRILSAIFYLPSFTGSLLRQGRARAKVKDQWQKDEMAAEV